MPEHDRAQVLVEGEGLEPHGTCYRRKYNLQVRDDTHKKKKCGRTTKVLVVLPLKKQCASSLNTDIIERKSRKEKESSFKLHVHNLFCTTDDLI